MSGVAVYASEITKSYIQRGTDTALHVLDNVCFAVPPGEIVSILGPSGAGKTTLMRIVAGLIAPTAGKIRFEGPAQIGYAFQEFRLFPWWTVQENISLTTRLRGISIDTDAILNAFGLEGFAKAYPHELSIGMQQRVSLARAVAHQPTLLLLDEALSALDEGTHASIMNYVAAAVERLQCTTLFITHSAEDAVVLSDRVIVLSARPATITQDIKIRLPRPRSAQTRNATEAQRYVQQIREHLIYKQ